MTFTGLFLLNEAEKSQTKMENVLNELQVLRAQVEPNTDENSIASRLKKSE